MSVILSESGEFISHEAKRVIMPFAIASLILPRGFTFAQKTHSGGVEAYPIRRIYVIRHMSLNWLSGDSYMYLCEEYSPLFVEKQFVGWECTSGHVTTFSKQFAEGIYVKLDEDIFRQFAETRVPQDTHEKSPDNNELFCDLKNAEGRKVVWIPS